jgi:hypothetical protein
VNVENLHWAIRTDDRDMQLEEWEYDD